MWRWILFILFIWNASCAVDIPSPFHEDDKKKSKQSDELLHVSSSVDDTTNTSTPAVATDSTTTAVDTNDDAQEPVSIFDGAYALLMRLDQEEPWISGTMTIQAGMVRIADGLTGNLELSEQGLLSGTLENGEESLLLEGVSIKDGVFVTSVASDQFSGILDGVRQSYSQGVLSRFDLGSGDERNASYQLRLTTTDEESISFCIVMNKGLFQASDESLSWQGAFESNRSFVFLSQEASPLQILGEAAVNSGGEVMGSFVEEGVDGAGRVIGEKVDSCPSNSVD